MGTAALVLGILSLLSSVVGGAFSLGWIGTVCGVIGIVLGAIGSKKKEEYAKAGLILSIVAVAWGVIATIACFACIGAVVGLGSMSV